MLIEGRRGRNTVTVLNVLSTSIAQGVFKYPQVSLKHKKKTFILKCIFKIYTFYML